MTYPLPPMEQGAPLITPAARALLLQWWAICKASLQLLHLQPSHKTYRLRQENMQRSSTWLNLNLYSKTRNSHLKKSKHSHKLSRVQKLLRRRKRWGKDRQRTVSSICFKESNFKMIHLSERYMSGVLAAMEKYSILVFQTNSHVTIAKYSLFLARNTMRHRLVSLKKKARWSTVGIMLRAVKVSMNMRVRKIAVKKILMLQLIRK